MNRCLMPLLLLLALPLLGVAEISVAAEASEDQAPYALDISMQRQHQSFTDTSADLDTIALQPHFFFDHWDFSLLIPWQHAQGEYFVNGFQPQTTYLCQRFGSLTDAQIRYLQRRGRIDTQALGNYCSSDQIGAANVEKDNSGLSDISFSAHYGFNVDAAGTWIASAGVAYKWDNGDPDTGIGSGTRESSVDTALSGEFDHWRTMLSAGYAFVTPSDADNEVDDYAFASLDVAWKMMESVALGTAGNYEQSYVPGADDIKSAMLYLEWSPVQWARLKFAGRDYLNTEGFPDREYIFNTTFLF